MRGGTKSRRAEEGQTLAQESENADRGVLGPPPPEGRVYGRATPVHLLMLEYIILLVILTGMAKRGRGRRRGGFGRYIKGPIDLKIAGGTLAANTAVLGATQVVTERTWCSSVKATYGFSGFTGGDNIGPVSVGVAHSDYSLAEIEAYLEQTTGWNEANLVSKEISSRKIRRIGMFTIAAGSAGESSVLNDGKPITTKLGWMLSTGQGLNYYIYNHGSSPFATTDPDLEVDGHANLWPR